MKIPFPLKLFSGLILVAIAVPGLYVAFFGWNVLRQPIERLVFDKTGRQLSIHGDVDITLGWPYPRLRATDVSFANPPWAGQKQMITSEAVDLMIDLPQLLQQTLVLPEVRLKRPVVNLEQGLNGQKNWLLDANQQDESARLQIGRLTLDNAQLSYEDAQQKTRLSAEISTSTADPAGTPERNAVVNDGLVFTVTGRYKGMPLKAHGKGGAVLALRDDTKPYPLSAELTIGHTGARFSGSVTSLLKFTAIDVDMALQGASLAQLYPLLGIAFPETPAYATTGHLVHREHAWRYEKFSGRIGQSDMAGSLQVDLRGKRPALNAELVSKRLDFADLGPLIGAWPGRVQAANQALQAAPAPSGTATAAEAPTPRQVRVLPDIPFKTERWNSVDAEVSLKANSIHSDHLPLENFVTHLSLRDSVLTLDPLDFGVAGGQLKGVIAMDGRSTPIQTHAQVKARKLLLAKLFPGFDLNKNSIGQLNGAFDLKGSGNSVRTMLATSSGKIGLVVSGGEISRLMMERAGLHLWEILELNVAGDKRIKIRCGVADFEVREGLMQADALVFDTEVTTLIGTGNINLAQETIDLTLNQKTKNTSPLALRSPIRVRGYFAQPEARVDKGPMAARAFGAIALGMINPLLALIPLIDAGPGSDSDCRQLIRDARALPRK
jgi:uncharacterized protein involved in outer membrane biogenesis